MPGFLVAVPPRLGEAGMAFLVDKNLVDMVRCLLRYNGSGIGSGGQE